MIGKPYSVSEVKILKRMAGIRSARVISWLLDNRSVHSVREKAHQLNIRLFCYDENHHNCKYSDEDVEMIRCLYDEGLNPHVIAEKMEIPKSAVKDFVQFRSRTNKFGGV